MVYLQVLRCYDQTDSNNIDHHFTTVK